MPTYLDMVYWR